MFPTFAVALEAGCAVNSGPIQRIIAMSARLVPMNETRRAHAVLRRCSSMAWSSFLSPDPRRVFLSGQLTMSSSIKEKPLYFMTLSFLPLVK